MKEAVRFAPDELEFRYKLARHYLAQRNDPEAQRAAAHHLQELHARSPVNIVVLLKLTQVLLAQEELAATETLCQELMTLLGDTDPEKLAYLTQGIAALQAGDLPIAARNLRIFENVHRASPRYQQGIGELVTDILGHPIESFSPEFKARLATEQRTPITVEFLEVTEPLALDGVRAPLTSPAEVALIDVDGDGDQDLYITGNGTLLEQAEGVFSPPQPLQAVFAPHTVAFADLRKDGTQTFLVQTRQAISQHHRDADRNWSAAPLVENRQNSDGPSPMRPVDFDHDGDLDIFSGGAGGGAGMYRNNGNGTFTDVSERTFVSDGAAGAPAEIVAADFDDDGDIDIFVTHQETGCTLYDNLRQGKLRGVSEGTGIPQGVKYSAAAAADYDNDGDVDLFLGTAEWLRLYRNSGDGTFVEAPGSEASVQSVPPTLLKNVDYDNDGFVDLWVSGEAGMFLFRNDGTGAFAEPYPFIESVTETGELVLYTAIAGAVGDYDADGDLDLFFLDADGQLRALQNRGGNQNSWIQVRLEGITAGNNKVNRDAIGSKVEVKVGDLYQLKYVSEPVSHFGLGVFGAADVVRVVWTNGVPQNVVAPQAKQRILEKQVLKGSCPFLYVYDGETYQFVTDLLWRAPLGLVTAMGFVAPDETKDFVKIPGDLMQPESGQYAVQITEELWETAYFDQVKLIAVDHPEGTDVFVNEQYTPPPFAPFHVYGVAEKRSPLSATDHHGRDVSEALSAFDYRYAVEHEPGAYQGVVDRHAIVLDLGAVSNEAPLTLFLTGWIFPTDTSINVALFQNPDITPSFPSIAVKDGAGEWRTVVDMIGIPAGKNKTIAMDLTGIFLSEDRRVRIETDMQIYWDAAFFTAGEQAVPMEITTLDAARADLHYRGFSEMYRPNAHAPHLFDYQSVTKSAQWRDLAGDYTRYGDVTPLLDAVDDMYVILNAGDEITVRFSESDLPELKPGWVRDFILYSDGWDKDGDINTLTSQTVEPLPFHGMSRYPYPATEAYPDSEAHRRYRREYNTRRVEHTLPPLDRRARQAAAEKE